MNNKTLLSGRQFGKATFIKRQQATTEVEGLEDFYILPVGLREELETPPIIDTCGRCLEHAEFYGNSSNCCNASAYQMDMEE